MRKVIYLSVFLLFLMAFQSKGQAPSNKAYGDNMVQVDVIAGVPVFAIYSGDMDQDGLIDGSDFLIYDTDAQLSMQGYVVTDLNGDGVVDGSDFLIFDVNAQLSIQSLRPY